MRTPVLLLAASLFTGCIVGDDPAGEAAEEVLGGYTDYGDPAVGMLRNVTKIDATGKPIGISACTATLIAPRVMVTAAHCLVSTALWTDVTFQTKPDIFARVGALGYVSAAVVVSPLFTGDATQGHDIAVALLGAPLTMTPIRRGPAPTVGGTVRAVGFGMNVFGSNGAGIGTKRQVSLPVLAVKASEFTAGLEGDSVCHGDSGGPVFSGATIVGTSDYVDTPDCHGSGHFMRLDDNLPFLHLYAPGF